jgi:hypothetical protein
MEIEDAEFVDEDIGRVYRYRKGLGSNQYIIRVPASIGRNPKFPFTDREPVRIRIDGERLIIEKIKH